MTKVIQKILKTPMVTMVVLMAIAAVATALSPYSTTEDTYAKNPGASTDDLKVKQCVQEEIDGSPPGSLCGPRERSNDEDDDDDDDVDEISDERLEAISVPLPPPS